MNSSPPNERITSEKAVAPMKSAKMNEVVCIVSMQASRSTRMFSLPLSAASSMAPKAPRPAASVGVAMPKKIEPSTATISAAGGITASRMAMIDFRSTGGRSFGGGARSGRNCASTST